MTSVRRLGGKLVTMLVVVGVVVAVVIVMRQRPSPPPRQPSPSAANGVVEWVIDGDTVDITFGDRTERVRLIGIDTPEIAHESSDDRPGNEAECYGPEATEFTRSLVPPGTPVRVDRDVVGRDDYGRLLAYVFRADDDVFVNFELVQQGYARPLSIPPNTTFQQIFADAANQAERSELGLWMACR